MVKELLIRQDLNINMKDKVHSVSLHTIQSAKGNEALFRSYVYIYIPHVIAHIMYIN